MQYNKADDESSIRCVFTALDRPEFPSRLPDFCAYIGIEPGAVESKVSIQIELMMPGASGLVVIYQFPPQPAHPQIVLRLKGIELPAAGDYRLSVSHEGEVLAWLRLFTPRTDAPRTGA